MKIEPKTLKGFRDFLPNEARKRAYVLNTLKKVFESYGFEPLETPVLEYEEILLGKYGDEGDKLMYRFEDNGKRKVAMRYDQTVPLARVVAQYANELPLPFKRYQIQNVYRADNTQKGRYREFLQVDVDTVGSRSTESDAEIISLVIDSFKKLGFKNFKVLINDRSSFEGIDKKAVTIIDKLEKIGNDQVVQELKANGFSQDLLDQVKNAKVPASLEFLKKSGIDESLLEFSPTLARGLDYYTGLILEVVAADYTVGSLGGGGRYDDLIGMFGNQSIPAVGFAFGFDRIIEAMGEQNLFDDKDLGGTKVLVTNQGVEIANQLRKKGINAELYIDDKDMDKQLRYADRKNIPFVLIVEDDKMKLKNMKTGEAKQVTLEDLPDEQLR
jgi:histidyl-tRNA synthetase